VKDALTFVVLTRLSLIVVQFYIEYASIALLYYDYALTFRMEVKYIWSEKFRFSTVLYIWCRYALITNVIFVLTLSGKLNIRAVIQVIR